MIEVFAFIADSGIYNVFGKLLDVGCSQYRVEKDGKHVDMLVLSLRDRKTHDAILRCVHAWTK